MARRKRDRSLHQAEAVTKLIFLGIILLALAGGSMAGFAARLSALVTVVIAVGAVGLAGLVGYALYRQFAGRAARTAIAQSGWQNLESSPSAGSAAQTAVATTQPNPCWSELEILKALAEIDWFQFEKFCAAVLRSEGFQVERKGGAKPDGGVDLVATNGEERLLIQCKHWRSWSVQEKVIREMLGSMTHFAVTRGALYTLKGATRPAAAFAAQHGIVIVDGAELARRAVRLSAAELESTLRPRDHHCPKCEAPMVWRTGDFTPFWGCSTFPRCRGTLKSCAAR
jgi:hypothetical protein